MIEYRLLLECYRSGQVSEAQWQEHLRDEAFRSWLEHVDPQPIATAWAEYIEHDRPPYASQSDSRRMN